MIPVGLLALAALAQLADLFTYSPAREANPIVLFLGDWANFAKLGLIASLCFLWVVAADNEGHTGYAVKLALCLAVAVGIVGALSNVL